MEKQGSGAEILQDVPERSVFLHGVEEYDYNQPVQPGLLFSGAYYPGADDQRGERGPEEEIRTDGYISSLFHINGCPTLIWSKVLRVYCVYSV